MKSAHITPILKKADLDSSDPKLYWPISNLSVLSKLLGLRVMSVYNLSQYLSLSLFYSFFLFDVYFYFCKRVRLTYVLNSDLT